MKHAGARRGIKSEMNAGRHYRRSEETARKNVMLNEKVSSFLHVYLLALPCSDQCRQREPLKESSNLRSLWSARNKSNDRFRPRVHSYKFSMHPCVHVSMSNFRPLKVFASF